MRTILLMLLILTLANCQGENKEEEVQIYGLWHDDIEDRIWYLKDSVGYFFRFSPISNWKIDGDTMKIMDFDLSSVQEYRIMEHSKDSLKLSHLNKSSDYFRFHRIGFEGVDNRYGLKKVKLKEFECMGDPKCMLTDLVIDFSTGDIVLNIEESGDSAFCTLEEKEINSLYYLFNHIQLDSLKSEYFSNNVGSVYYELQMEFIDSSRNLKVITDSGAIDTEYLNDFISVVWAISYLSCSQNDKLNNRILH
jgi:hypothetical protein